MSNLVLQSKKGGDSKPHPEDIHPAVCVDVMNLDLMATDLAGYRRRVHKIKLVFKSEPKTEAVNHCMTKRAHRRTMTEALRLGQLHEKRKAVDRALEGMDEYSLRKLRPRQAQLLRAMARCASSLSRRFAELHDQLAWELTEMDAATAMKKMK